MTEHDEKAPLLSSTKGEKYSEEKSNKEEKQSAKGATFGQLFRYATALDKFLIFIGSVFAIAVGGGWPALSVIFGELTDTFVSGPGGFQFVCINGSLAINSTGNTTGNDSIAEDFNEKMSTYAFYYLYIAGAVLVSGYLQIMCWTTACERQIHAIRKVYFRSIVRQEIGWFDKHQSGELTTRLSDDINKIKDGLGDKFSFTFQYTAQFFSGFAIGFWKSWKMTLVMMSVTPLLAVSAGVMSVFLRNYTKREQESYAGAGSVAEEVLSCIRTVISFNGQRQEQLRYENALKESRRLGIRKSFVQGLMIGSIMFLMFGTYALAFWYGSEQVKDWYSSYCAAEREGISPGEVLTVFFCVMIGSFSIGNAAPHLGSIFGAKGAAAEVFDTIDNVPEIDGTTDKGEMPASLSGDIDFVGVDFTYPTREDVKVLKNFNLSIGHGQTVALVGSSGCGKSTVVNLIQRMYDPEKGRILLDGKDIKELNTNWLRNNIGVVSQEPVLFGMTIAENIKLGNTDATIQEIEDAAKAANAHDFITKLPHGYRTLVGERGAQLSGGQKQRVAIARALIRNPRILLLDEATSALDSESEKIVQSALDQARLGRTTVMVAHRLTTVQNADIIYVVDKGEIIEYGTHSQLMQKEEFYYQLVQAQSLEPDDKAEEANGTDSKAYKRQRSQPSTSDTKDLPLKKQLSQQISVSEKEKEKEEVEEEEAEPPKYFRILRENFPECPFLIFGVLFSAIQGSTMPLFALFFGEMIKVFIDINESDNVLWSMMFLALGGLNFICHLFMNVNLGIAGERMTFRLRLKVFKAYLRQDPTYFDDPKHGTGSLTTRLATDASLIKTATGFRIGTILSSIVSLVAALVIAFYYGWKLALVVLAGVPILMLSSSLQIKVVMGKHKDDQNKLEDAGKVASETIENIRTVQSLTREKHFFDLYASHLESPLRSNLKQAQLYGFAYGFSQSVVFAMYGGAFRFGAWQVSLGEMAPENVYKVFFAIAFTGMTIGQASSFLPDYSKAKHAAALIFKVLETIPGIDIYSSRGTYMNKVEGKVVFKNVSFSYPMRSEVRVLKSLSLKAEPGQTVALVGPSGCGKSTAISLLQRFYDVQDGEIDVDGVDVRNLNLNRLRSFISVVSQEPILFDCSIRENISYGLDSDVGMDDVIEAARKANIHDFITTLPMGYETLVGEKGTQLSGGQKQRVAIARAIVRNPTILLLDEATSALDTESEKQVQAALDAAQKGRTCIVIAHRLSTIQNCDVIYVIDEGQVVESGTHQSLLSLKGVYSALVSAQQFTK
uniref:Multidrug resistance protein 1-like isoform X1 n=1 Tax=Crassostrea virginica TaxID=6565 RepID=A0A8B8EGN9_CRAVI|nr:multidrug resistance protein 1-like isoform X1 [Crassostrea virginica]